MTEDETHAPIKPPPAPPCAMVIFGGGGDLTRRLLVPALYNLERGGLLPEQFYLLNVGHSERPLDAFRVELRQSVESFAKTRGTEADAFDAEAWGKLAERSAYLATAFTKPEAYRQIAARLDEAEQRHGTGGNVLFYLAVAEQFFAPV